MPSIFRTALAFAAVVAIVSAPTAQSPSVVPAAKAPVHAKQVKRLLIRNAMLITGNATPAYGPVDILAEDGLLARIGNGASTGPDRWPEPECFRPERFLETKPTPYEFLPFGGGVRRCLGMAFALVEMKIVLAEVLSRVELRTAPGYQVRVVRRSVTLAPSEGMPVVVERRAG